MTTCLALGNGLLFSVHQLSSPITTTSLWGNQQAFYILISLESILAFQSLPLAPLDDSSAWRWAPASALAGGGGGPLHTVLPRERYSQESRRKWWSSLHSESLPCTFQSQPACSDLLHPEGCYPVSNPCKGQNHMVNAPIIPISDSSIEERQVFEEA